jgi:hypothetical protein
VGGYIVRARRGDAWDSIITLLLALETEREHDFHAVMEGCRRLSNSRPEVDALDNLLMTAEQRLCDIALEREGRRSRQGYATPADARAFLQMARQPRRARGEAAAAASLNPIATAYFRAAEEEAESAPHRDATDGSAPGTDIPTSIDAVIGLLEEAGVIPKRPRALLEAANEDPRAGRLRLLRRLMEFALHHDETAYLTRSRELAFLANTLLAGCSVQSRPFTPQEASDAAASVCNLGLECWPARWPPSPGFGEPGHSATQREPRGLGPSATSQGASASRQLDTAMPPNEFLLDRDLVTAFEVGWSVLYAEVSVFAANQLISTLPNLHCANADARRRLRTLQRKLIEQQEAGTPWLARDAADVLAMLDMTAWISVLGLLDECPILAAALTAVLDGRTTRVSPTAFEFISTTAQIGDIRRFMMKLPGVISS